MTHTTPRPGRRLEVTATLALACGSIGKSWSGSGSAWQPCAWLRCTSEVRASHGFRSDADRGRVYSFDSGVD